MTTDYMILTSGCLTTRTAIEPYLPLILVRKTRYAKAVFITDKSYRQILTERSRKIYVKIVKPKKKS